MRHLIIQSTLTVYKLFKREKSIEIHKKISKMTFNT